MKWVTHGMVVYDALYAWCADAPLKRSAVS